MAVVLRRSYVHPGSESYKVLEQPILISSVPSLNKPDEYLLCYTYEITLQNNSDYTAYNLAHCTNFYSASATHTPEFERVSLTKNAIDSLAFLMVYGEHAFIASACYAFNGSLQEATEALKTHAFKGVFRIEYTNIKGKKYCTTTTTGHSGVPKTKFGSV